MQTLSCPSCGANVNFVSKASIFAVCTYCKSTLVRHDMDLEKLGQMSELQNDLTPIQVGTAGMFDKEKFEVIGRMKIRYDDGFWNEWFTLHGGSKTGWLVEAQGFFSVCFPATDVTIPKKEDMRPGKLVDFSKHGYWQVEDVHNVECIYSEGELPVQAVQGRKSLSVDLTSDDNGMATIEFAEKETRIFLGDYQEFDDFQFKNLRHIDGW